jgi:hypothetical protein
MKPFPLSLQNQALTLPLSLDFFPRDRKRLPPSFTRQSPPYTITHFPLSLAPTFSNPFATLPSPDSYLIHLRRPLLNNDNPQTTSPGLARGAYTLPLPFRPRLWPSTSHEVDPVRARSRPHCWPYIPTPPRYVTASTGLMLSLIYAASSPCSITTLEGDAKLTIYTSVLWSAT